MSTWYSCSDKSYVESVVSFLHDVVPQVSKALLFERKNLYFYNVILYMSAISNYFYPFSRFIFNLRGILGYLKSLNSRNFINNFNIEMESKIQLKNVRDYN